MKGDEKSKATEEAEDGGPLSWKVTQIVVSVLCTFTVSGVVFGISALGPILLTYERAFEGLCHGEAVPCQAQQERVALVFTTALTAASVVGLPMGFVLDKIGPKSTVCISAVFVAAGHLALAFAKELSDSLYFVGMLGVALGGPPVFASVTNFCELFPRYKSLVLACQVGAFQVSSVMLVFVQVAVQSGGLRFKEAFLTYLIVPVLIFVASAAVFPNKKYGSARARPGHRGEPHRQWVVRRLLLGAEEARAAAAAADLEAPAGDAALRHPLLDPAPPGPKAHRNVSLADLEPSMLAPEGAARPPPELYNVGFWRQLLSPPGVAVSCLLAVQILTLNYYITSVEQQLVRDALGRHAGGDSSDAAAAAAAALGNSYFRSFNVVLSAGALAAVPVAGFVLDCGVPLGYVVAGVLYLLFLAINTFAAALPLQLQFVGFLCFACNRPFIFGAYSNFVADVFGFRNFGKMYGSAQMLGAILTPLQFFLLKLVNSTLGGDFFWVNFGFLVAAAVMLLAWPYYIVTYVFSGFVCRPKFVT